MRRHPSWLCVLVLAAGCGGGGSGAPPTPTEMEGVSLGDVGELYRMHVASKNKPPEKFADFNGMDQMSPTGYNALKTGAVVLRYGAPMADANLEGPAKTGGDEVLAYQKEVPTAGGKVLMLDRSVKTMTADEFKSAKKAGKDPAEPSAAK